MSLSPLSKFQQLFDFSHKGIKALFVFSRFDGAGLEPGVAEESHGKECSLVVCLELRKVSRGRRNSYPGHPAPRPTRVRLSGETSSHAIFTGTLNRWKKLPLGEPSAGSQAGADVSTELCGHSANQPTRDKAPEGTRAFPSFPAETVSTNQSAVPQERLFCQLL